jgi:hypothetical protein
LFAYGWSISSNDRRIDRSNRNPGTKDNLARNTEYQDTSNHLLIGMGSRRRSASQAIDLPSDEGGKLERLFTASGSWRRARGHGSGDFWPPPQSAVPLLSYGVLQGKQAAKQLNLRD